MACLIYDCDTVSRNRNAPHLILEFRLASQISPTDRYEFFRFFAYLEREESKKIY